MIQKTKIITALLVFQKELLMRDVILNTSYMVEKHLHTCMYVCKYICDKFFSDDALRVVIINNLEEVLNDKNELRMSTILCSTYM